MARHHTIISGTGRAGTTFLMQLFTRLGLATGFKDTEPHICPGCNAGMEWDIRDPEAPYIIKDPCLCDYLDSVLESGEVVVDHAIVPLRNLFAAAESRRYVTLHNNTALYSGCEGVPEGLWATHDPDKQESILTGKLYNLIYTLARRDIPTTLLYFPRLARKPEYLFEKLKFLLLELEYHSFLQAFNEISKPDLVHEFQPIHDDRK